MAFSGRPIWEVRTTGSDTNGGAFINGSAGSDYSQQNSPQYSGTDLEVNGSNNLQVKSTTAGSPIAADVGNLIMISNGLSWTFGWYEIVSQDGTWWTLDRSPGFAGITGGHFAVGGALASPGVAVAVGQGYYTGSNLRAVVYIQSGTYAITNNTTATPVPASGCYIKNARNSNIYGYDSTNGRGSKPTTYPILQSQSSYTGNVYHGGYSGNASYNFGKIMWLELDGNGLPGSGVSVCSSPSEAWECTIKGPKGGACAQSGQYWHCTIDGNGMNAYQAALTGFGYYCYINSGSYRAYALNGSGAFHSVLRGGTSSYPVVRVSRHGSLVGCRVYSISSASHLIHPPTQHQTVLNNIFVGGSGTPNLFNGTPSGNWSGTVFKGNYYYNCNNQGLSGLTSGFADFEEAVALSQDPFVDAANGDFTLDSSGADYTSVLSANYGGLTVENTSLGPRVSAFTENVGGGSTVQTVASIERLK